MVVWKATIICVASIRGRFQFYCQLDFLLMPESNFYKHELLQKYEWYWRLEPEIKYFCDIT